MLLQLSSSAAPLQSATPSGVVDVDVLVAVTDAAGSV
jgi:hypothetical protein